jgi:catechol 2,3-dioxygenase-like lactoylglutathione lyase family enzyme
MALQVTRAGAILAVSDFERSVGFYRDRLGFELEATYDDPPYATLARAGTRLSIAEVDPDGNLIELEEPA